MSFKLDVDRFVRKTNVKRPKFMRKVLLQAFKELTQMTPVKTGRAKANWFPQEGSPSRKTTESTSSSPPGAPADFSSALAITVSGRKDLYVSNNLPYISRLEHGSSRQAPLGMLRVVRDRLKKNIESGLLRP